MREESFGIIPLKASKEGWQVFLIQHKGAKHWGFPKGKGTEDESSVESASRELLEETGLIVEKLLSNEPFAEEYTFTRHGKKIHKKVQYFPALVTGDVQLQSEEIMSGNWFSITQAGNQLTFSESKRILSQLTKKI